MSDPTKIYLNPVEKDQIKQNTAVRQLIECASDDRSTIDTLPTFVSPFTTMNFYVDPVGGNDSNDGLTPGTAWKTLLIAALNVLDNYFAPNSTAKVNLANGTYTVPALDGGAYFGTPMNWAEIDFIGNPGSPSSVIIDGNLTTGDAAFYISQNSAGVTVGVNGVQIQNFGSGGHGFNCQSPTGTFKPQNIIFAGGNELCFGIEGGFVEVEGPITFSGTNAIGVYTNGSAAEVDFNGQNIIFIAGAAFSFAYINIDNASTVSHSVGTITGTCTGTQFFIGYGGLLRAVQGGVDKDPSTIPGSAGTGQNFSGFYNNVSETCWPYTIATLPTPTTGLDATRRLVTNASSTASLGTTLTTGGAAQITAPVYYDFGAAKWRFG